MSADPNGKRAVRRSTRYECSWCSSKATHRLFVGAPGNSVGWGCDRHAEKWLREDI